MTAELRSNRDLYLWVADLPHRQGLHRRSLEDYLMALWQLAAAHRAELALSLPGLAELLLAAFSAPVPAYDPSWANVYDDDDGPRTGHAGWEAAILRQIVDLHEMAQVGTLTSDLRYFGIDSPRGNRWYNFDPGTFLECAVAGTVGGWQDGDDTERVTVPGQVAVLDEAGRMSAVDPAELATPTVEVDTVTWDQFAELLWAGQHYE